MKISNLERSIIKVSGQDAKIFLQGLISNDINLLETYPVIYSGMFTSKGRYNFDFFVLKDEIGYLVDIAQKDAADFMDKLTYYKLISQVEITELSNLKVYALFEGDEDVNLEVGIVYEDVRKAVLGHRFIGKEIPREFHGFQVVDKIEYDYKRYQNAVLENSEMKKEKSIPLECGFDDLKGISYTKGCYLGQEFTNACKNTLVIRKRVTAIFMGDLVANSGDKLCYGEEIVGEVLGQIRDYAVVLLKVEFEPKEKMSFQIKR